ncbi:MAG: SGNH/GDSL hydrolase family protein [Deltaproteobacteria bacterium]|nr:SGNH/GDSL hydrolase family protein [Deltaproteobacteria bacterium]
MTYLSRLADLKKPARIQRLFLASAFLFSGISAPAAKADRILFIGDSHAAGTFGRVLDERLRTIADAEVTSFGSCGSSPAWWFKGTSTPCGYFERLSGQREGKYKKTSPTPLLPTLLETLKPGVVIIEQGANLVLESAEVITAQTRKMAEAVVKSGARCAWIGPPHSRKYDRTNLYETLEPEARRSGCAFIDSRPFTHYPATGGDGVHYDSIPVSGRMLATTWAESVLAEIKKQL